MPGRGAFRTGLDEGAQQLTGQLGKTVQRLRKAYNLSLSDLAEQSGVAKSIISQIERNETNPTLATIWRLSQALDVSIERVLACRRGGALHREDRAGATRRSWCPRTARCGSPSSAGSRPSNGCSGTTSSPNRAACWNPTRHQRGSIECLSVISGEIEVEVGDVVERAGPGETLRYRCDRRHVVRNARAEPAHATMVCILKAAVME